MTNKEKVISIQEFCDSPVFSLPTKDFVYSDFVYSPVRPSGFSAQGEEMVNELLKVAPNFAYLFDHNFSPEKQRQLAEESFEKQKQLFLKSERAVSVAEVLDQKPTKKYFQTNRKFNRLVPILYHRTAAPRLSTKGGTFHGMKKMLLLDILMVLSIMRNNFAFLDFDMGAAHTRIACFLLANENSQLDASLKDPEFWQTQIQNAEPCFQKRDVLLKPASIKKILKEGIYTSLNGGNPISKECLLSNLSLNAEGYLKKNKLVSVEHISESALYRAAEEAFTTFPLLEEVKRINTTCTASFQTYEKVSHFTYTVNQENLY